MDDIDPVGVNRENNTCFGSGIVILIIAYQSALRGILDQYQDFDQHWSALGIDRGSPDITIVYTNMIKEIILVTIDGVGSDS